MSSKCHFEKLLIQQAFYRSSGFQLVAEAGGIGKVL
jgi:hypothetical protein